MTDFLELARDRYSCRSFSGAPAQAESVLYNTTPLIVDKTTASAS